MSNPTFDTYLKTEEFITADEYLRRRKKGEINPNDVRIVLADINTGSLGGFVVKLKTPEYRISLPKLKEEYAHGWW